MRLRVVLFALALVVLYMVFAPTRSVSQGRAAGRLQSSFAAAAPASSNVLGRPSLSAAFVDQVLTTYHSPAVGLGVSLVQLSQTYNIDDVFALAFFMHESSFGVRGMAAVTHSLGNIRCTAGWSCSGGYRWYPSWRAGALDWFQLLTQVYIPRGLTTVETIIPVYAPAADNNDEHAYIAALLSAVSAWRAGRVLV